MPIFDFPTNESIGSVYSVDTGTVLISVSNLDALRRLQVNHLVVLRSSRAGQHMIGLINKIILKIEKLGRFAFELMINYLVECVMRCKHR